MIILDNHNVLVLKDNNKYIGSMKYEIKDETCIIKVLYIVPHERKKRYCKYLFDFLFEKLKITEIKKIDLEAKEYFSHFNKLVNYYKSFGFIINNNTEIYEKWIDGQLVRLIKMVKFLKN
jgi:hypothetical protein